MAATEDALEAREDAYFDCLLLLQEVHSLKRGMAELLSKVYSAVCNGARRTPTASHSLPRTRCLHRRKRVVRVLPFAHICQEHIHDVLHRREHVVPTCSRLAFTLATPSPV